MKKYISILILFVVISLCMGITQATATPPEVRNVILFIGDGMGLNHQYGAYTADNNDYVLNRCHSVGLVRTSAANGYITDSAAAGTAIACGEKTNNGMLGLLPDNTPVKSILEYAADDGRSTGILVTCELTHATPAAFVAHVDSRSKYDQIALELSRSKINVAIGGGRQFFEKREDGLNITASMKRRGFQVAYTLNEMKSVKKGNLLALLADVSPEQYPLRGELLTEGITTAIRILNQNKKGFFLMVEGSQIDGYAHQGNQEVLIQEILDLNRAIKIAYDFAEKDGKTLVIVTADHETGGMSITQGDFESKSMTMNFACTNHTGVPVPIYAFGPGAEKFTGLYENTEIFDKMMELLQINKKTIKLSQVFCNEASIHAETSPE